MSDDDVIRRRSDQPIHTDEEILKLIQKTSDENQKAILLVLYEMNQNLIKNNNDNAEILKRQEQSDKLLTAHQTIVNKGLGVWKAITFICVGFVAMGGYILHGHLDALLKE